MQQAKLNNAPCKERSKKCSRRKASSEMKGKVYKKSDFLKVQTPISYFDFVSSKSRDQDGNGKEKKINFSREKSRDWKLIARK